MSARASLAAEPRSTKPTEKRIVVDVVFGWVDGWMGPTQQTTGTSETRRPLSSSEING